MTLDSPTLKHLEAAVRGEGGRRVRAADYRRSQSLVPKLSNLLRHPDQIKDSDDTERAGFRCGCRNGDLGDAATLFPGETTRSIGRHPRRHSCRLAGARAPSPTARR